MEIRDYLRAIRRILWLVIAVPIVAGLLVGGFIEMQPSSYQATATAVVPAITANGISQSAASQYADTFKDVLDVAAGDSCRRSEVQHPAVGTRRGLSSSTDHCIEQPHRRRARRQAGRQEATEPRRCGTRGHRRHAERHRRASVGSGATIEVVNAQTLLQQAETKITNFTLSTAPRHRRSRTTASSRP